MKKILFLMVCLITLGLSANAQEKGNVFIGVGTDYTNTDISKRDRDLTPNYQNLFGMKFEAGYFLTDNLALVGGVSKSTSSDIDRIRYSATAQYTILKYFLVEGGYGFTNESEKGGTHSIIAGVCAKLPLNKVLSIVGKANFWVDPSFRSGGARAKATLLPEFSIRATF